LLVGLQTSTDDSQTSLILQTCMLGGSHSDSLRQNAGVSCDINKGMHGAKRQNSLLRNRSLARVQHTQLHGLQEANRVTETTNMGQSNVQTWSQYLQYFFLTSLWKSGSPNTPSGQLAWQVLEY
jgi:hypothetical protein